MFCTNTKCRAQLGANARFCSQCGTPVQGQNVSTPAVTQHTPLVISHLCPTCGSADKVSKVSTYIERDIHQVSGTTQTWVSDKDGGGY
jgi:hypothetical protein